MLPTDIQPMIRQNSILGFKSEKKVFFIKIELHTFFCAWNHITFKCDSRLGTTHDSDVWYR